MRRVASLAECYQHARNAALFQDLLGQDGDQSLHLKYDRRLTDPNILANTVQSWRNSPSALSSELVGFLLVHSFTSQPADSSKDARISKFDEYCQRHTGIGCWQLYHMLHGFSSEDVLEKICVQFLFETNDLYSYLMKYLFGTHYPSHHKMNELIKQSIIKSSEQINRDFIINIYRKIEHGFQKFHRNSLDLLVEPPNGVAPIVLRLSYGPKIVMDVRGGREDLRALQHSLGHALHFAFIPQNARLAIFHSLASSECFAFTFQWNTTTSGSGLPYEDMLWERFHYLYSWRIQIVIYWTIKKFFEDGIFEISNFFENLQLEITKTNIPLSYFGFLEDCRFLCFQFLRAFDDASRLLTHFRCVYGQDWWFDDTAMSFLVGLWQHGNRLDTSSIKEVVGQQATHVEWTS